MSDHGLLLVNDISHYICNYRLSQGDGGLDLIAFYQETTYVIQCKDHMRKVGIRYIREFEGVIGRIDKAVVGILVTPDGRFTTQAKRRAETSDYNITLTDKDQICSII